MPCLADSLHEECGLYLELGIRIFVHSKNQFMGGWQKSR